MPGINERLIVALDVDDLTRAEYFVNTLSPKVKIFKVGSQFFTACGPQAVRVVRKKGAEVFLDLKFYDIPNTVANAVRQAVRLKVKMLTLHIAGGEDMLKAAARAAKEESIRLKIQKPLLVGITVLTSQKARPSGVLKMARIGLNSGLDGVVCSAQEAAFLRKKITRKFFIITPGIRLKSSPMDDQKRAASAGEAIKRGADYIVVGRPILEAKEPALAVDEILGELYDRGN